MKNTDYSEELDDVQDLPVDPRLIIQSSYGTIRYLIDAVVELVTNSDDSYKRLEYDNINVSGKIKIRTRRRKGSKCELLEVTDFAEGMDREQLKSSLKFAAETSGFEKGQSVRGFFGRGLKESIIALGKGEIYTIKDNMISKAVVWADRGKPKYRPPKDSHKVDDKERNELGLEIGNGTLIRIKVTNEKIMCPDYKTFIKQIQNHYALRDINTSQKRKLLLIFESPDKGLKKQTSVVYDKPQGKKIVDETVKIPTYGDEICITIYEFSEELETPYNNPFARAGLLIKSSNAILDIQLFRFQNEKAGNFFYGEVVWNGLADRLRSGESLLDLNRVGIEWKQEVCQVLQNEIERILTDHIERKKMQLLEKPTVDQSVKIKKLNKAVCSLLNKLAKEHFKEVPPDVEPGDEIKKLTIKPPYANLEIDKERIFSVYAPIDIIGLNPGPHRATVTSSNPDYIQVLNPTVLLQTHRKYPLIFYGNFRIIGRVDKEEAVITCSFKGKDATTNVRVAPPGKIGKRRKKKIGEGGLFRAILPDLDKNPSQRVRYDESNRVIWISVRFPGLDIYFEDNLNFRRTDTNLMYAELIGEAFCKYAARDDIEKGKIPVMSDSRDAIMDVFLTALNNSQRKYLYRIHEAILKKKIRL